MAATAYELVSLQPSQPATSASAIPARALGRRMAHGWTGRNDIRAASEYVATGPL